MVVVFPAQQLPALFIEDLGMLFHLLFDQHFEVLFLGFHPHRRQLGEVPDGFSVFEGRQCLFKLPFGFVSGTVGIGGGIYLVPLIILFGLGTEQEAAASGAAFILLNSMAGLVARFQRGAVSLELMLPLLLAVLAGGFLGSRLGAMRFNPLTIQKILGLVVILALLLLSRNIWFS